MDFTDRWAKLRKVAIERWSRASDARAISRTAWRALLQILGLALRVAAAAALVVLAFRLADGDVPRGDAVAAAGLVVAAVVIAAITPRFGRGVFRRLSKVSVGPVGLELDAQAAATTGDSEDREGGERKVTSVSGLRLQIERKLAYIAKEMLDENGHPTFVTVGSLEYDGYISALEARTVSQLMSLRDEDLDLLDEGERRDFIDAASKVATNIRASVLNGKVRKILPKKWEVTEIPRTPRPDLLVEPAVGKKFHVVPVFATVDGSEVLGKALDRLRDTKARPRRVDRRVVVLPHRSGVERVLAKDSNNLADVMIVDTDQLTGELKEQSSPGTPSPAD